MPNKIYRKNFEIRRTAYHMATPAIIDMMLYQPATLGRRVIKELIWLQKDYNNPGSYVPVKELRELVKVTIELILKRPAFVQKIHRKTEKYALEFYAYVKKLAKMKLGELSNLELSRLLENYDRLLKKEHGFAITTTWFVDSDGEDFSQLLIKRVENILKAQNSKLSSAEVFTLLTSPDRLSLPAKEEIESLRILKAIKDDKQAFNIFKQKDLKKIEKGLVNLDKKVKNIILNHYRKWRWLPYTYIGPAYDLDYYLSAWSGLLKEKVDIKKHLKKLEEQPRKVKADKEKIIGELKVSPEDRKLFEIAAEIIYLKALRKDVWFCGCFALEKVHKEMAKRLGLSLKQVRFMADWEYKKSLKNNYFDEKILNERIKFSVYHQKGLKGYIYHGKKARDFLKRLNFEKEKIEKASQMKGTCACPGRSKGEVKVINVPEEMGKMKKGNIMVAHSTFPALIPAMKKASALVTDDGGITCHAAIVSREMNIPCIVGTKIVTKVLKDGDKVKVDATRGIIRKL